MSIQHYYRTDNPEILAAMQDFEKKREAILSGAADFARHFGGKAVFSHTSYSWGFHGLKFQPEKPKDLWLLPDEREGYIQRPRTKLKSPINKELKEPHKALLVEWDEKSSECFPDGKKVQRDDLNTAIGYCDGTAIICGDRFLAFSHDGFAWVTTTQELKVAMPEVTASEFELAQKAAGEAKVKR